MKLPASIAMLASRTAKVLAPSKDLQTLSISINAGFAKPELAEPERVKPAFAISAFAMSPAPALAPTVSAHFHNARLAAAP
jgi:hypothetical protein